MCRMTLLGFLETTIPILCKTCINNFVIGISGFRSYEPNKPKETLVGCPQGNVLPEAKPNKVNYKLVWIH